MDVSIPSFDPYGVFREENGLSIGDPYIKETPQKNLFRQFKVSSCNNSELINKSVRRLEEGEPYKFQDLPQIQKDSDQNPPFKPSNPGPQSNGKGTFYGAFNKIEYLCPENYVSTQERVEQLKQNPTKRQIYTSNTKKGGAGYALQERTIGNHKIDYISDPYDDAKQLSQKLKQEARRKINVPFKSSFPSKSELQKRQYLVDGQHQKQKSKENIQVVGKPLWRPPNPAKLGIPFSILSKIGQDYIGPNYGRRQQSKSDDGIKSKPPFKPNYLHKARFSMWTVNPYEYPAKVKEDLGIIQIN